MRSAVWVSLALAASVLAACGKEGEGAGPNEPGTPGGSSSRAFSQFDPLAGTVPFPFFGLQNPATSRLSLPLQDRTNPLAPANAPVNAANLLDGFSTVASAFTDFIGFVNLDTARAGGLLVIEVNIDVSSGAPVPVPRLLSQSTDAGATGDYVVQNYDARDNSLGLPISSFRTRLMIEPARPLKPATTYVLALTNRLLSTDGVPVDRSPFFRIVSSSTPVASQAEPVLGTLSETQIATLEAIRQAETSRILPVVVGVAQQALSPTFTTDEVVLAWSFTTQSIGDTLAQVVALAPVTSFDALVPIGTTDQIGALLGLPLPPGATIFKTVMRNVPYYLADNSAPPPAGVPLPNPLTAYWLADPAFRAGGVATNGVPCDNIPAPVLPPPAGTLPDSTTRCFPRPLPRSVQNLPVLVAVPNGQGGTPAAIPGGFPVAIFQHGITQNRSNLLFIASSLARAGFVSVAIDLPLHGVTDPASPLRVAGVGERNFDLDVASQDASCSTTAPFTPDGAVDCSGSHFINLASLATSRDNLRQAVADLSTLARSARALPGLDLNPTLPVSFVGHSLGGIVGATFLGVSNDVGAASLGMPGGGIGKLLDASATFGGVVAAGLAANGVNEGTDSYETFLRIGQTVIDSADPINYAVAARAAHPIHLIEVLGDQVVPNNAIDVAGVTVNGYLSGTDPLIRIMGQVQPAQPVNFAGAPLAVEMPQVFLNTTGAPNGLGVAVPFRQGEHGSLLDPGDTETSLAVTVEMQTQIANFLASGGQCLPVGASCQ
ncbi:MAG: hypothetical protein ACT4QA_20110 [Panacagrimonas sp.]